MSRRIERRDMATRPKIDHIVEVDWLDHYSFEGNRPADMPVEVKSWGKLIYEDEKGLALSQTEVTKNDPDFPVNSINQGQYIVRGSMTGIKKVNP